MSKSVGGKHQKLSLRSAFLWILLATLLISGSAYLGILYYRYIKKQRLLKSQYKIVAIVQTTPEKERLKTIYLAELLNLSIDHPTNLFRFNAKEAQNVLTSSPLITSAKVKKIIPGTVHIDYKLRKPVAYLLDYTNTVIDQEGVPFPFKPFFTPKKIPEVFLGMTEPLTWGKTIHGIKVKLALYLIELITENCCKDGAHLSRVDVSNALSDSNGQRQIIVIIDEYVESSKEEGKTERLLTPYILRLSVDNYRKELANYLALRSWLRNKNKVSIQDDITIKPKIIDLRIPELAYINERL